MFVKAVEVSTQAINLANVSMRTPGSIKTTLTRSIEDSLTDITPKDIWPDAKLGQTSFAALNRADKVMLLVFVKLDAIIDFKRA
ncbi:MAG TPA: hypothetical protein VIQ24_02755 [Pyrinomonadaceae bacterium]